MRRGVRVYLAEVAELVGGLACALVNHSGGCALLRYSTRRWNPVAALYHWGTDVACDVGREVWRCGCGEPTTPTSVTLPAPTAPPFVEVVDNRPGFAHIRVRFSADAL